MGVLCICFSELFTTAATTTTTAHNKRRPKEEHGREAFSGAGEGKKKEVCVCVSGSPPLPSRLLPCYITPTSCNIIRTVFLEFYGTQPVGRSNDSKGNSSLSHSVQRSVAQHRIKVIPRNWFMTGKRRPFHMQKASILSTRSVKILRTGEVQYSTNVPSTYLC